MSLRRLGISILILVFLLLSACGGGGGNNNPPPPPPNPDFSLSVTTPMSVVQGASGSTTVKVSPLNGFSGSVDITFTISQNGITAAPIQVAAGQSGTLVVAVDQSVPTGAYNATVTGKNGKLSHNGPLQVNVTPAPWHIGNGSFTSLVFTSKISNASDQKYITDLYNKVYPVFVSQFDLPPDTTPLTLDLCSWSYGADTHTICVSVLPTAQGTDQNSWDAVFLHELGGAMWLSQHTGVGSNWIAEAVGDIGTVLGQRVTGLKGQAFFTNELDYDVLRLGGKEIVGGIPGKAWTTIPQHAGLNEESAKEILQILVGSQSIAANGDWVNYNALKDLKAALYAKVNACQCTLQDSDVFAALSVYTQPIEGVLLKVWVPAQPVAYTKGTPGTYAYVYAANAANPSNLEVVCFTRTNVEVVPGVLQENACSSGTLTITVSNASGTVETINFDLASAGHELALDISKFPLGSYRIQDSGTANGVSVTAPDSYFGVFDSSLVPFPQSIGTLPNALFLIGKNADGTSSAKVFPAPTGGAAGKFLENGNGAAVWQVDGTTIPQPEYSLNGRRLYVPLPFSPLYVVENP